MELRHTIAYVNDAVIPQVRSESISAMRKAADKLRDLADRFEQKQGRVPDDRNSPPTESVAAGRLAGVSAGTAGCVWLRASPHSFPTTSPRGCSAGSRGLSASPHNPRRPCAFQSRRCRQAESVTKTSTL